jgi:hypothetical protein
METALSLKDEVNMLAENKLRDRKNEIKQNQDPPNDLCFKELKDILTKFNKEYFFNDCMRKIFLNKPLF